MPVVSFHTPWKQENKKFSIFSSGMKWIDVLNTFQINNEDTIMAYIYI